MKLPLTSCDVEVQLKSSLFHPQGRSIAEHRKRVSRLMKAEEKKREKLKSFGIDYDFPGYKAIAEEMDHHTAPKHMHFEDSE